MQKLIRITAIIATALTMLGIQLVVLSVPVQPWIAENIYHYPKDVVDCLPIIPFDMVFSYTLRLDCMALLIICCGNKKGGIWLELIAMILLAVVLPEIDRAVAILYTQILGSYGGHIVVGVRSFVNNIANYCLIPCNWGYALSFVAGGMSIVHKLTRKTADHQI